MFYTDWPTSDTDLGRSHTRSEVYNCHIAGSTAYLVYRMVNLPPSYFMGKSGFQYSIILLNWFPSNYLFDCLNLHSLPYHVTLGYLVLRFSLFYEDANFLSLAIYFCRENSRRYHFSGLARAAATNQNSFDILILNGIAS